MLKIKLILNPTACRQKARQAIPAIKEIFSNRKVDLDIAVTERPQEATHLSREATRKNFDIIAAAGGDGTVNEVVNGMMESSSMLGVIPLGLGNDFAKAVKIPFKLKEACLTLCSGRVKEIDVGRVNERYFVNAAGIGFDAQVARESREIEWFFLPGWIYRYVAIRKLFRYDSSFVNIELNDLTLDKKVLLVAIGNGKTSGGGFLLTPEAELDDGLMDVCVIDDVTRLKLLAQLPRAFTGTLNRLPYVTTYRTSSFTISAADSLLAHLDGELLQDRRYKFEISPKRLRVIIPKQ